MKNSLLVVQKLIYYFYFLNGYVTLSSGVISITVHLCKARRLCRSAADDFVDKLRGPMHLTKSYCVAPLRGPTKSSAAQSALGNSASRIQTHRAHRSCALQRSGHTTSLHRQSRTQTDVGPVLCTEAEQTTLSISYADLCIRQSHLCFP
jgi:hypothetical protein